MLANRFSGVEGGGREHHVLQKPNTAHTIPYITAYLNVSGIYFGLLHP
jgi:hypothetical protein